MPAILAAQANGLMLGLVGIWIVRASLVPAKPPIDGTKASAKPCGTGK